jgi:hypothetical protein
MFTFEDDIIVKDHSESLLKEFQELKAKSKGEFGA